MESYVAIDPVSVPAVKDHEIPDRAAHVASTFLPLFIGLNGTWVQVP
jgi:hypothetical protein